MNGYEISDSRISRIVERIGNERVAEVQQQAAAYEDCPETPAIFVDASRMSRLTREIKEFSGDKGESAEVISESGAAEFESFLKPDELHVSTRPKPWGRSVIATTENIQAFGKLLVGAAHARGFMAAELRLL